MAEKNEKTEQLRREIWDIVKDLDLQGVTVTFPAGEPEKVFVIWSDHTDISRVNDEYNKRYNAENWAKARPIYLEKAEQLVAQDKEKYPQAHPSNQGPTGGPFAHLRTHRRQLTLEAVHSGGTPSQLPESVFSIEEMEDAGVETGFSDEYSTCDTCMAALRTQPNGYGWEPDYDDGDGLQCADCLDPDDYLSERINKVILVNENMLDRITGFPKVRTPGANVEIKQRPDRRSYLEDQGFERVTNKPDDKKEDWNYITFEVGLHEGQDDDMNAVVAVLNKVGIDVVFTADVQQFATIYTPWVRASESEMEPENYRALCSKCGITGQAHGDADHTFERGLDESARIALGTVAEEDKIRSAHDMEPALTARARTALKSANTKLKHSPHDSAKAALMSISSPAASISIQPDGSAKVKEYGSVEEYIDAQKGHGQ